MPPDNLEKTRVSAAGGEASAIQVAPKEGWNGTVSLRKELLWAFLLAPSPFYACFDGCLGHQVVLPLILVWVPLLTLFSLLFPLTWLWHIAFLAPYFALFRPVSVWLHHRTQNRVTRYGVLGPLYFIYWFGIAYLWFKIPEPVRQSLLGQRP